MNGLPVREKCVWIIRQYILMLITTAQWEKNGKSHIPIVSNKNWNIPMFFDVQLSIWRLWSCSTDGVKNALLISHLIKFRLVEHGHKSDKWS